MVSADLDELKKVNDREGHPAGDAMITAAAEVLKSNTRAGDVVARVGGDEFLVLLTEADEKGAQRYLRRVRSAIRRAGPAGKRSALRMSVGAATARKEESLGETVTRADRAMYVAKKRRTRQRTS